LQSVRRYRAWLIAPLVLLLSVAAACSSDGEPKLFIGGIPDQDEQVLQERFEGLAEYLSKETGLDVRYVPTTSYAAVVTGFRQGDVHMAWYGGLTGVQARLAVPGAEALAQRSIDQRFETVFLAAPDSEITTLADLKGKTFTFGSESSTSGRLMPAFFMTEAGLRLPDDLRQVNFSGAHDRTWKLVEAGAFDAGALNANVWRARVEAGEVDLSKADAFWTTPSYYNYHWVARGDLDEEFGGGTTDRLRRALLAIDEANGGKQKAIMDAFQAPRFIETNNGNYTTIEQVARGLGLIR